MSQEQCQRPSASRDSMPENVFVLFQDKKNSFYCIIIVAQHKILRRQKTQQFQEKVIDNPCWQPNTVLSGMKMFSEQSRVHIEFTIRNKGSRPLSPPGTCVTAWMSWSLLLYSSCSTVRSAVSMYRDVSAEKSKENTTQRH